MLSWRFTIDHCFSRRTATQRASEPSAAVAALMGRRLRLDASDEGGVAKDALVGVVPSH